MLSTTKRIKKWNLLLSMAIDAVSWSEGSDFEWNELIGEGNYVDAIEELYGVKKAEEQVVADVCTLLENLRKSGPPLLNKELHGFEW